jgi:hypothetical protein
MEEFIPKGSKKHVSWSVLWRQMPRYLGELTPGWEVNARRDERFVCAFS